MSEDPPGFFDAFVREDTAGRLTIWLPGLRFGIAADDVVGVRRGDGPAPAGWAAVQLRVADEVTVTGLGGAPDPAEFATGEEPFVFRTREHLPLAEPNTGYARIEAAYRLRHGLAPKP